MAGSNNYLGLTTHPSAPAAMEPLSDMARVVPVPASQRHPGDPPRTGRRLAEFIGKEAALCFSTGYQTNLGTISALVGRGEVIITDKEDTPAYRRVHHVQGTMKRFGTTI